MPLVSAPSFKATADKMMEIPQPAIKGLNLKDLEYEQEVNQSPYMLNMMYRNGAFSKRYGQEVIKTYDDEVFEIVQYRGSTIVHSGTKLYKDGTEIAGFTVPQKKGLFINFNRYLYYIQGPVISAATATYVSTGITAVSVDLDKYTEKYTSASKTYTYDGTIWKSRYIDDDIEEKLASLGITITGTPSANDTITVTLTKTNGKYSRYDGTIWEEVEPYVPTIAINLKPDGTDGDTSESYNILGSGFQNNFHGDNSSTTYVLTNKYLDNVHPKVTIDNEEWTYDEDLSAAKTFKCNYSEGKITLKSAAPTGTNNVEIIAYKTDDESTNYKDQILSSKFYQCFGGNNNSRLFLAGNGKSTYYYSDVFDGSYFPYTNYSRLGNSADDITGFGQQYNVLLIFKPTEIYSLTYYQATSDTTTSERQEGIGMFSCQVVNASMGCDCPYTIQVINNQLTWFSSKVGVCTLVSTNIVDERNVRRISDNINKTNNFDVKGLLDIKLNENNSPIYETVKSVDYDNKYFICFPKEYVYENSAWSVKDCGITYCWDYLISPYVVTSSKVTSAGELAWYKFDNIFARDFEILNNELEYVSYKQGTKITEGVESQKYLVVKMNNSFADFDYEDIDSEVAIVAYYMTPFFQFEAVEYLKTIKNLYIQCRGDTSSIIDVYYYTDESLSPEQDAESIRIGSKMWGHFAWDTFEWFLVNWANTFRRKCSLKKIQMASFFFKNDQVNRDMSITHIALQYQIIKYIK